MPGRRREVRPSSTERNISAYPKSRSRRDEIEALHQIVDPEVIHLAVTMSSPPPRQLNPSRSRHETT